MGSTRLSLDEVTLHSCSAATLRCTDHRDSGFKKPDVKIRQIEQKGPLAPLRARALLTPAQPWLLQKSAPAPGQQVTACQTSKQSRRNETQILARSKSHGVAALLPGKIACGTSRSKLGRPNAVGRCPGFDTCTASSASSSVLQFNGLTFATTNRASPSDHEASERRPHV